MPKEIKTEGWRKEVKHAKKMIKTLDRTEAMNRLQKLRDTCKKLRQRWIRKQQEEETTS